MACQSQFEIQKPPKKTPGSSDSQCLACKGRLFCGLPSCPLMGKICLQTGLSKKISKDVFGKSTNLFVGWSNYPNVSMGPLVAFEEKNEAQIQTMDSPAKWLGKNFDQIIEMRSGLAMGRQKQNVKQKSQTVQNIQDIVMSERAIDAEVKFEREPKFNLTFSSTIQPMGPTGEMLSLSLAENPKIPRKIDSIVNENITVREILPEITKSYDSYYIQKLLNAGLLGRKKEKKILPTRWSITATDDILGKQILEKIRNLPQTNEIMLFSNTYLFNHFEILLIPGKWEFEQFEAWAPKSFWNPGQIMHTEHEYEPFEGRTNYAEQEGGGYYAGRLGCLEGLEKMGRQARAVIFREISEEYKIPVGVWEVRENARQAMKNAPAKFQTMQEAFSELRRRLKNPLEKYLEKSIVLRQKKMTDFF